MFPQEFIQQTEQSLGQNDTRQLLSALDSPATVSIRYNPFKIESKPEGEAVPWNHYGYYLESRPVFTLDPRLHG